MSAEFQHYQGCNHRDPDNCGACALTLRTQAAPNYSGWPLAYMENRRAIPIKWEGAFWSEFDRTDNPAYVANLRRTLDKYGVRFEDGRTIPL